METTHMSFSGERLNKLGHIHHGIQLCNKKEWSNYIWNNLDMSPGKYAEWKDNSKSLYIIKFHSYDILGMTKEPKEQRWKPN